MRPQTYRIVVALAGLLLGWTNLADAAEPVRRNGWLQNNFEAAQTEARQTGKPIFVVVRCEA